MSFRTHFAASLLLCACSSSRDDETELGQPEPSASESPPTDESPSPPEQAPACHNVPLERAVCADAAAECEAKQLTERSCAAGCPTAMYCLAEIASGDLYTMACGWALEDAGERLRPCTDDERQRWQDAL